MTHLADYIPPLIKREKQAIREKYKTRMYLLYKGGYRAKNQEYFFPLKGGYDGRNPKIFFC